MTPQPLTLVADSGATKTDWLLGREPLSTPGINPVADSPQAIRSALAPLPAQAPVATIHFYGAGCTPPYDEPLRQVLQEKYPAARVNVYTDLLGAARALCPHTPGIACILGTGSNSCLWDGERIVAHTPALGYLLGDEGGGASLGRRLASDLLKGLLPPDLLQAFTSRFRLTQADVIENVYRRPAPNRFLASLVPFLAEQRKHPAVHTLIVSELRRFLSRNVSQYGRADLPVNFVGGVAHGFRLELQEATALERFTLGAVLKAPIQALASYHGL